MANIDLGPALIGVARDALERAFGREGLVMGANAGLDDRGATFVTLTQQGELRGCIGTLKAHRSLRADVAANAVDAAFHDPRFPPLDIEELPRTRIEVSQLSSPVPIDFADEGDLLRRLAPGIDGVVLEWQGRRATFLPQVWATLPDPRQFINALKDKAGLASNFWSASLRLSRYTVRKWKEDETVLHAPA